MEEKINKEDSIEEVVLPSETKEEQVDDNKQDPLKTELENLNKKGGRSKKEKLLFSKQRIEEQLAELGDKDDIEDEDDKPVTMKMLKEMQAQKVIVPETALQLADSIENETERELTKYHLENTIRPTGDPKQDLALAAVHVNAVKNKQIVDQVKIKPPVKQYTNSGGTNPDNGKIVEELDAQEILFTKPPFNLTKQVILELRKNYKNK